MVTGARTSLRMGVTAFIGAEFFSGLNGTVTLRMGAFLFSHVFFERYVTVSTRLYCAHPSSSFVLFSRAPIEPRTGKTPCRLKDCSKGIARWRSFCIILIIKPEQVLCCGTASLREGFRTKGVIMDSNFLMFLGVMVVIIGGGVYLYMKG